MPSEHQTSSDPAEWVDRYGDGLFRYAMLRVRDTQLAEDLVQETFLGALKGREGFQQGASEWTWLVAILKHRIISHLRKVGRQPVVGDGSQIEDVAEIFFDRRGLWKMGPRKWAIDPEALCEQGEFWDVFHNCVSRLPPRVANAFCLREMDQLDSEKVCEVLGISANNLWTQIHRARMLMRRCLEHNWFARPGKE